MTKEYRIVLTPTLSDNRRGRTKGTPSVPMLGEGALKQLLIVGNTRSYLNNGDKKR